MKRTPLKSRSTLKRSTFKRKPTATRKKKTPAAKLRAELWELCKQATRARYANKDGTWNCYTCGRLIDSPAKAHTGHFIPSSTCGVFLRYDLRNLRVQDYFCNINNGGAGAEFYKRLVADEGQAYVDQLFKDKNKMIKGDITFFKRKIGEHTHFLQTLYTG